MRKCAKTWESVLKDEKVWKSVLKVEKVWERLQKAKRVWQSAAKVVKVLESASWETSVHTIRWILFVQMQEPTFGRIIFGFKKMRFKLTNKCLVRTPYAECYLSKCRKLLLAKWYSAFWRLFPSIFWGWGCVCKSLS